MLINRTFFRNFVGPTLVTVALSAVISCFGCESDVDVGEDAGAMDAGGIIWVDPVTGECPTGMRPGGCGLRGRCIECMSHEECAVGPCDSDGLCHVRVVSAITRLENRAGAPDVREATGSFGFASETCSSDEECGSGERVCINYRCVVPCSTVDDCSPGQFCHDEGYCDDLKCPPKGECPAGFHDIEGSFYCYYVGDPELDGGAGASDCGGDD